MTADGTCSCNPTLRQSINDTGPSSVELGSNAVVLGAFLSDFPYPDVEIFKSSREQDYLLGVALHFHIHSFEVEHCCMLL